ncbi:tetratricopeptide repeat protein [candidate division CSSED10-310 bacterium]|uniref:Tetratricopeptide repeat protein n=1 Tax=candidate division CSSED10-310 bacterium TaxID=2855610 RepID=A0ABV6Z408_UNCC1
MVDDRTIGPYLLAETLGQGGMGVVYSAHHMTSGEAVALKTVRVHDRIYVQSLRREISALARIHHPGIIRIIDHGLDEGLPWYAMELVAGVALNRWRAELLLGEDSGEGDEAPTTSFGEPGEIASQVDQWWTLSLDLKQGEDLTLDLKSKGVLKKINSNTAQPELRRAFQTITRAFPLTPEALIQVLPLFQRLCAALSFLHGQGIVHRDLKPNNIIVRPDGTPILVDFGLFTEFGGPISRETLSIHGHSMGTVNYMAPEQIRGDLVDARADLYALGIILFEFVTGKLPFASPSVTAVLKGHLEIAVQPPSEIVPWIPLELDQLIIRLLSKEPRKRLGYADDVALTLTQLGGSDQYVTSWPKPHAYLYRAGFVGRDSQLILLRKYLNRLRVGHGAFIILEGESGVGKTRLAMEISCEAIAQEMMVLTAECPVTGALPLQAFRTVLQNISDRCREKGIEETNRLLGPRAKVLALYEPGLHNLPGLEVYPDPVSLPAGAARHRLFTALLETLMAWSARQPLLLMCDDLQWADELSIGFLEFLLSRAHFSHLPVLMIGTHRTDEACQPVQKLKDYPEIITVSLSRLDQGAVAFLVSDMLALDKAPPYFCEYLDQLSGGNPFFVAEFLRTAIEEEILWRDEAGCWQIATTRDTSDSLPDYQQLPLPRSLQDLITRRLTGLTARTRTVVEAAAVVGREVQVELLLKMIQLTETELLRALEDLLRFNMFEEPEPGKFRFIHDKMRAVTYQEIDEVHLPELHGATARGIESLYSGGLNQFMTILGHHWEKAGHTSKAKECYLAAARQARNQYAHQEAAQLYHAYFDLVEKPTPEKITARNELAADILRVQGQTQKAIQQHLLALDEAKSIQDPATQGLSLRGLGIMYRSTGQMDKARQQFTEALSIFGDLKDRTGQAQTLANLAGLHYDQGRLDEARQLCEQALHFHRESNNLPAEAVVLGNLALLYTELGQFGAATRLYKEALKIFRDINDKRSEGITLGAFANLHLEQGLTTQAQTLYDQALTIVREVGDKRTEGLALGALGMLHLKQDLLNEAQQLFELALNVHRSVGDRRDEGVTLGQLALVHCQQQRENQALTAIAESLKISAEIGNRRDEGIAYRQMATIKRCFAVKPDYGEPEAQHALNIFEKLQDKAQLILALCEHGHGILARGNSAQNTISSISRLSKVLTVEPEHDITKAISHLELAQKLYDTGQTHLLHRGESIQTKK